MADRVETNVRVPSYAVDALEAVVARRRAGAARVSRDGVIRDLLDEHLALQEQRAPEDRLTHISTGFVAVSSGFGDQVSVVPAWRVDEGVGVSLAA